SKMEFGVPDIAIKRGGVQKFLRSGLVHRTGGARDKLIRFRLVHPGLGELLLSAVDQPIEEDTIYRELVLMVPSVALMLAWNLERSGQENSAIAVARLACEEGFRLR